MIHSLALILLATPMQSIEFPYQRYAAAEDSRAGFRGESTLHDFEGEVTRLTAALHADLARLPLTAGGEVRFRIADLLTGDEDRDEGMRGDLDAGQYPEISFRLDRLEAEWSAAGGAAGQAAGAFMIHGVERARVFPIQIERQARGRLAIRGSLRFLQTEHGIKPHSTFGLVKVHDEVEIWFDLKLDPVASPTREGETRAVQVVENTQIPGSETKTEQSTWRLWSSNDGALIEGGSEWWWALGDAGARMDPRAGLRLPAARDAEEDFAEARERLAVFEARLASLSVEQRVRAGAKLEEAIARLRQTIAAAPAEGPAEVDREGNHVDIMLGDRVWVRLEGLSGEARVPAALAALPNLPGRVREALRGLRGTPQRAVLYAASTAGTRELQLEFAAAAPCRIPLWALDPAQWPDVTQP